MDAVNKEIVESVSDPSNFHLTHLAPCTNVFTGDGDETQQTSETNEVLSPPTAPQYDDKLLPRPKRNGLTCFQCGSTDLLVKYTRHRLGVVIRRRECACCGTRLTTWERRVG